MLSVYICEDDEKQREMFNKIVCDIIMMEAYDMKLELSTVNPYELLKHAKEAGQTGIYFLDIELTAKINGIELAAKIRKFDPRGFIIFITTHSEMTLLTFEYKVEAMDYIIKNEPKKMQSRIHDCIKNAYARYTAKTTDIQKLLSLKVNDRIINIEFDQILFIETSNTVHKLTLHALDRQVEFYARMKDILSQLDDRFYRCHNSYIVNRNYIKEIDIVNKSIHMKNGEECMVSSRMMKGLVK